MPSSTPLNIDRLEKNYKRTNNLTFIILILVTLTLGVVALTGFILIQKNIT